MLIRGADGRLYEVSLSGLNVSEPAQSMAVSPKSVAGDTAEDNAASAGYYEPPFPPSFP